MESPQTLPAPRPGARPGLPPTSLPPSLAERVQLLVAEYAGALPPGAVVTVAEAAAAALRGLGVGVHPGDDFVAEWQDTTRRRLSEQVVLDLASARRAQLSGAA